MQPQATRPGAFERHVQTLLVSVCTAGVTALAAVGWQMSHALTRQTAQIDSVLRSVDDLRLQIDETNRRFALYIPRIEADAQFRALHQREDDHSRRIERLESRAGL